jgi:hypothetical protein
MLILVVLSARSSFTGIATHWILILPAVTAFAMYSLTFAEARYMTAWQMLVWAAFLFGLRIRGESRKRILPWLAGFTAAIMLLASANGIRAMFVYGRHDDATTDYRIVEELQQLGLRGGQKVAAIGFDNDAHWAYLARFFVVAEIDLDQTCEFWSATPDTPQEVLDQFKRAGASLSSSPRQERNAIHQLYNRAGCSRVYSPWTGLEGNCRTGISCGPCSSFARCGVYRLRSWTRRGTLVIIVGRGWHRRSPLNPAEWSRSC